MAKRETSFLLGAGFSVEAGYPTAALLSKTILKCKGDEFGFHTDGQLVTKKEGGRPYFGYKNSYDIEFDFLLDFIKVYQKRYKFFNYENFYDVLLNPPEEIISELKQLEQKYLGPRNSSIGDLINGCPNIFNQVVSFYLKDKNDVKDYVGEPSRLKPFFTGYTGFLNCIEEYLKDDSVTHVHTLNHDLFFERLNRTEWINGQLDDGFTELGSPYYGELEKEGQRYKVRLPYYSGNYSKKCRLYKLHGSKDYVRYFTSNGGMMVPDKFIKTKYGVGFTDFYKECRKQDELYYDNCWINYHAVYLTGTESKIEHYKDPMLFSKLFEFFKENLSKSDQLIICGYGGRDEGVNQLIEEEYKKGKIRVFIVDPFPQKDLCLFAKRINGKIIKKGTNDIKFSDLQ